MQGYLHFKVAKTMAQVRSTVFKDDELQHVHLEAAKGSAEQNKKYCTKPDTAWKNPDGSTVGWERGKCPSEEEEAKHQGKRNDIKAAMECYKSEGALACATKFPETFCKYERGLRQYSLLFQQNKAVKEDRPVELQVILGAPGTGKTRLAREMSLHQSVYWLPMRSHARDSVWFDGYDGQDVIILDNFSGDAQLPWDMMLRINDRYPWSAPIKGGHVQANWRKVIITSSVEPQMWYPHGPLEMAALWRRMNVRPIKLSLPATDVPPAVPEMPAPVLMTYAEASKNLKGMQEEQDFALTQRLQQERLEALSQHSAEEVEQAAAAVAHALAPNNAGSGAN